MLNQDIVILVGCLMVGSIFLYVYLMCRMRDDHDYAELAHPSRLDTRVNRVRHILGHTEIPYDCATITTLVPDNLWASDDQPANSRSAEYNNQLRNDQNSQNQLCQQATPFSLADHLQQKHKQRRLSSCSIVTISSNSSSSSELQLQSAEITIEDSPPAPDESLPQKLRTDQNGTS